MQYLRLGHLLAAPPMTSALPGAPPPAACPPAPAAHVPPPSSSIAPLPACAWSNAAFRNSLHLEMDFGHCFCPIPIRFRDLLARLINTPPPVSSFDAPHFRDPQQRHPDKPVRICLSYHGKGMGNSGCGRACDHKPLTPKKMPRTPCMVYGAFSPLAGRLSCSTHLRLAERLQTDSSHEFLDDQMTKQGGPPFLLAQEKLKSGLFTVSALSSCGRCCHPSWTFLCPFF
jgi:hypothetical protein